VGHRRVRLFAFRTGKLKRTYDESPEAAAEVQRSEAPLFHLEPIDFGRRMAVERELLGDPAAPFPNIVFDESGNFLIYATLLGIKVASPLRKLCFFLTLGVFLSFLFIDVNLKNISKSRVFIFLNTFPIFTPSLVEMNSWNCSKEKETTQTRCRHA
jgi:hypothetical protein